MSYQIIPNIIFILAIGGIILLILRRLPEAAESEGKPLEKPLMEERLIKKGLPIVAISKITVYTKLVIRKVWQFILEAKDLKPAAATGYKIRKILGKTLTFAQRAKPPLFFDMADIQDEKFYLDQIKHEPKNLNHYNALGKFYIEQKKNADAKDIYLYLTNHDAGHSEYHAKLAFCLYQLKELQPAVESYRKSIALDSTHPNRYYNLGLCFSAQKNFLEAKLAFEKALEMEPANEKYKKALEKTNLEIQSELIHQDNK